MSTYLPQPVVFGGRVDTDEDKLRLLDGFVYLRGEEEILAAAFFHQVIQSRLQ